MNMIKSAIYFGSDQEFFEKLTKTFQQRFDGEFRLHQLLYSKTQIVQSIIDFSPSLIYFDFSVTPSDQLESILTESSYLKRIDSYKPILFVGLFDDISDFTTQSLIFTSGFQWGFVKGADLEEFFRDTLSLGFSGEVGPSFFARANGINKKLDLFFCSSISSINNKTFSIESDIYSDSSKLSFSLPLFKDLDATEFSITSHLETSFLYPLTDSYELEFPFAGPWDELSSKNMQHETVETWISCNKDVLKDSFSVMKLFSARLPLAKELIALSDNNDFRVEMSTCLDERSALKELSQKKYPLIFIEINEFGNFKYDQLAELINLLRNIQDYDPFLLIFNTSSKSEALQKAYGHKKVLSFQQPLSSEYIEQFTKKFLEKRKAEFSPEFPSFLLSQVDPRRLIDIKIESQITSLTEREITFTSDLEIPMYSVFKLELLVKSFVTLVLLTFPLLSQAQPVSSGASSL